MLLATLHAAGYTVNGKYATIDIPTAIIAADKRSDETGRYVPHETIAQIHRDVSETFMGAVDRDLFDSLEWHENHYDPVNPKNSRPSTLIASKQPDGTFTVHDQAAYRRFTDKTSS